MKALRNLIAALGLVSTGVAGGMQIAPSDTAPLYCAPGWRETTDRVPANVIPDVSQEITVTTCAAPDGKLITVDANGNPVHALDENGAPLIAPRTYLR